MKKYSPGPIEQKWQKTWEKNKMYRAKGKGKKYYALIEFPYPSGEGLHAGHVRSYTAMDIVSRKRRMEGYDVLYPIGWDAFGLPTENFAIKTGIHPEKVTKTNTDNFRRQLKSLGISFDWSREVNTTDPKYYKWTQWIFLKLFEKGLAYKTKTTINWCPKDKIGLANEEVVDGGCERCGTKVEQRLREQWMLAITKYASRLDRDLDTVDYVEKIKLQQKNWIGKSEGYEFSFSLAGISGQKDGEHTVPVFTTRLDTIYGVSFVAISPELAHKWIEVGWKAEENVKNFVIKELAKQEEDRLKEAGDKSGIFSGIYAVHPLTKEKIPVWIANYVLGNVGTGAIMGVPAHDERDFDFATKYSLPIISVIENKEGKDVLISSEEHSGLDVFSAKKKIAEKIGAKAKTTFKLRDWVFSRQRYWGEPIPLIHCEKCGVVPVLEKDLPVKLPKVASYKPTDTGESPLSSISKWVNTKCPQCKGKAKRETDVMPQWAGSSWYFLRYTDPKNGKELASKKALKYFTPIDWYNGGMEHTTLHLLYSRFWHKFLFDIGVVPTQEPYAKRTSHGLILASDGTKMSKSKGNIVSPDEIVMRFGADSLRLYEMFMGPFGDAVSWNTDSMAGVYRFLERTWNLSSKVSSGTKDTLSNEGLVIFHQTIKKVGEDIESLKMNTAVSQFMICVNQLEKEVHIPKKDWVSFLSLLAPFAPHIAEELYKESGGKKSVHQLSWPEYDKTKLTLDTLRIPVQINGKVRETLVIERGENEDSVKKKAFSMPAIVKWTEGKEIKRIIFVPNKLINFVL